MARSNLLKCFEYCIPGSNADFNIGDSLGSYSPEMDLPLVQLSIDFEKKSLTLEGNSMVLMTSVANSEPAITASSKERIKVKASFYPGFNASNGSLFPLKGVIWDTKCIKPCSGLLELSRASGKDWPGGRGSFLTVYLLDDCNDQREIRLKLKMYPFPENTQLN